MRTGGPCNASSGECASHLLLVLRSHLAAKRECLIARVSGGAVDVLVVDVFVAVAVAVVECVLIAGHSWRSCESFGGQTSTHSFALFVLSCFGIYETT